MNKSACLIEPTKFLERAMGIEPTSKAWEALILPMNYARWILLQEIQNASLIVPVKPCHSQRNFLLNFPEIELNRFFSDVGAV